MCSDTARADTKPAGQVGVSTYLNLDKRREELQYGERLADKSIYISCMKQNGWDLTDPGGLATTHGKLPDVALAP